MPKTTKSEPERKNHLFQIAPAAAVLIAIAVVISALPGHENTKPTQPEPKNGVDASYAKLDAIIASARIAVKGEPTAERLLENFAERAAIGKLESYGQVATFFRQTIQANEVAYIIFVTREDLGLVPEPLFSPFQFEPGMNAVVFADIEPVNIETLSTALLHELFHWQMFVAHGKVITTDPYTNDRLDEEVRAHELENRAVDRLTHGAFTRVIIEALRDEKFSYKSGERRALKPAGLNHLMTAWSNPPLSLLEADIRKSGIIVAFHLAQASDEANKRQIYYAIRKNFEANHQALKPD